MRTLMSTPSPNLSSVTYQHNYFDQAHFTKDFKALANLTPRQFLKLKSESSDFYKFNG